MKPHLKKNFAYPEILTHVQDQQEIPAAPLTRARPDPVTA
jgi:hypothetical protein